MRNEVISKAIEILITQEKLAKACGVSQSSINKWLYNKSKVSPENVLKIVKATNGLIQGYQIRPDLPDLFPKG